MPLLESTYVTIGYFALIVCIYCLNQTAFRGKFIFITLSFVTSFMNFYYIVCGTLLEYVDSTPFIFIEIPFYEPYHIQQNIVKVFNLVFFSIFIIYYIFFIKRKVKGVSVENKSLKNNTFNETKKNKVLNAGNLYLNMWKNVDDWANRVSRKDYMSIWSIHIIITLITYILRICVAKEIAKMTYLSEEIIMIDNITDTIFILYQVLSFFVLMPLTIRRCNDSNVNKLYSLFFLIPYIMWILLLFACRTIVS